MKTAQVCYGVFALFESIDDERENDEGDEHSIRFVELREDTPEAFKMAEQSLHFGVCTFPDRISTIQGDCSLAEQRK